MKPVAVLGAGFAGLTAAVELRRAGREVIVLEAGSAVGGLAASTTDDDGFTMDFGAHFITNRLAGVLGVGAACETVRRYGEAVWLEGQTFSYPFGLIARPDFTRDALRARLGSHVPPLSAHDVFVSGYGAALTNRIAAPLLEAWSGRPSTDLAPAVAEKLSTSIPKTLWLKAAGAASRRAVAIGYCRELPESAGVWHVYPRSGLGTLVAKLFSEIKDAVRLSTSVSGIGVVDDTVATVRTEDEEIPVDAVFSSAPVHVLPKLIDGSQALDYLSEFRYRPMLFVNLKLRGSDLMPDVVTWTPDPEFMFFRLSEPTQSMPWLAPTGHTLVTADIGCEVGDDRWTAHDAALVQQTLNDISPLIPDAEDRLVGFSVARTPFAYPVFARRYERERQRFSHDPGIARLFPIGRNGEFDHLLMEDVYWRTRRRVAAYVAEESGPATS